MKCVRNKMTDRPKLGGSPQSSRQSLRPPPFLRQLGHCHPLREKNVQRNGVLEKLTQLTIEICVTTRWVYIHVCDGARRTLSLWRKGIAMFRVTMLS
jgi:hypothetical protein